MHCDILINGCSVLNERFEIEPDQDVAIGKGRILSIEPRAGAAGKYEAEETIEGCGKLLLPGFIDGHTHTCQQLLRGRVADEYPMVWLRLLVPFESNLSPEDVRISAQLACLEMIKAGFTSFADAGGVHMDQVAEAVIESGMRAALCRSTMDMGPAITERMKEPAADNIRHTEELYRAYQGKGGGRVDVWFGLRQVMTCSRELIRTTGEKAREYGTGVHAHLCEHRDEVSFCLQNYAMRPAELLDELGVLGPNLLTAHNVTLSEHDITLLKDRDVKAVHCPRSNLSSHGFPKTPRMLEAGLNIGIGCDGASNVSLDMFEEMRILKYGIQAYWGLPVFDPLVMPLKSLLYMATQAGANALGHGEELGSVTAGKKADLILMDIRQPHLFPSQNMVYSLVLSGNSHDVTDSIIDGKLVMRGRKVLTLDEQAIMRKSAEHMEAIVLRAGI
ncbi:MAG TPA: amidohydrolase [Feifaniaceae bacterium]|nr:amidohydrolase [Feifaniaceae bacterium]